LLVPRDAPRSLELNYVLTFDLRGGHLEITYAFGMHMSKSRSKVKSQI